MGSKLSYRAADRAGQNQLPLTMYILCENGEPTAVSHSRTKVVEAATARFLNVNMLPLVAVDEVDAEGVKVAIKEAPFV